MTELKDLFLLLTWQKLITALVARVKNNLADVVDWVGKVPDENASFKDMVEWLKLYPEWEQRLNDRFCMLRDMEEKLIAEGFDRWVKSPEDGGIPF